MSGLTPADRLREASVVLPDGDREAWLQVIERSGRLKTSGSDLLDRVWLAYGAQSTTATFRLARSLPKTIPELPEPADQLFAVLAGAQLVELFDKPARSQTEDSSVDAAALAVRILARTSRRPVFPDLADHASSWLARRGDLVRVIAPASVPETAGSEIGLDTASTTVEAADFEAFRLGHNALGTQVSDLETALSETRTDVAELASALRSLNETQKLLAEQQQITWWALSSPANETVGWQWAYFNASALAALTRVLPGPRAARTLLQRRTGGGAWDPEPVVISTALGGDGRFSPATDLLRGDTSLLSPISRAEDAAMAIYDELLLSRITKT